MGASKSLSHNKVDLGGIAKESLEDMATLLSMLPQIHMDPDKCQDGWIL